MSDLDAQFRSLFGKPLREIFGDVRRQIDEAYEAGWRPPAQWQQLLRQRARPVGEDPSAWFDRSFRQFCDEVSFPPGWDSLHKAMLFTDLLRRRR